MPRRRPAQSRRAPRIPLSRPLLLRLQVSQPIHQVEAGRGEIRIALRELAAVPEAELHHVKATARTAAVEPHGP